MTRINGDLPNDALFSALIAVAVDGIIVIDASGIVKIYNQACERLFGYRSDEVVGRNIAMLMPEPFRSQHDSYLSRHLETGERRIIGIGREAVGRRKDGSTFPMYISVGEGVLDSSRIFVGIVHDISERHARERRIEELQRDLHHVTRLTTLGQLSSAIAHELNQPLAAGLNYVNAAQHLLKDLPGETAERAHIAVEKAATQISRAGEIIRRLREFIEKREFTRTKINVNATVEDAIALGMIGTLGAAIPIEKQLAPGLPEISGDRVQIQQVLINLMLNAADAVQAVSQPRIRIETSRGSHGAVRVGVVDNGIGMSDETRRSLFQPFVTTKPHGMGMGLSICRTIVEAHGGRLWAEAVPEGGTRFQFTLPVADDKDQA